MKNGAVETAGSPTKAPHRVVEIPAGVAGRLLSQSAQKRVVLLYSWHLVATLLAAGDAGIIDVHKNRPVHPRHPRRAAAHRSGVVVIVIAPRQNKKAARMGEPPRKKPNQFTSRCRAVPPRRAMCCSDQSLGLGCVRRRPDWPARTTAICRPPSSIAAPRSNWGSCPRPGR